METKLNEIVVRLCEAQGENLVSVILYGSAVAEGYASPSDLHLLVVTESLSPQELKSLRPALKWWEANGFPRATCFTKNEISKSIDVFPIEFRHMQRAYRVLAGSDLLAGVSVGKENLRLLVEYELRGKLLRLRTLYSAAGDDSRQVIMLMTESVVSFVQYLRPILELLGEEPPLKRVATARRIGETLKIDTAPLERVLRLREEATNLFDMEVHDLFSSYLNCLEEVIDAVDSI